MRKKRIIWIWFLEILEKIIIAYVYPLLTLINANCAAACLVSECVEISSVFLFKNSSFPDIVFLLLCLFVTKGHLGKLLYHIIM